MPAPETGPMGEEENDAQIKQGTMPQTAVEAGLVHSLQWAMRTLSSSRSALAKVTEERDALRGALEAYRAIYGHTHQAFCGACGAVEDGEAERCDKHPNGRGHDQCGQCGLDLRDPIHFRMGETGESRRKALGGGN